MYLIPTTACSDLIAITTAEVLVSQAMSLSSPLSLPSLQHQVQAPFRAFLTRSWINVFHMQIVDGLSDKDPSRGTLNLCGSASPPIVIVAHPSQERPPHLDYSGSKEKYGTVMRYRPDNVMHGCIRMRPGPDVAQKKTIQSLRLTRSLPLPHLMPRPRCRRSTPIWLVWLRERQALANAFSERVRCWYRAVRAINSRQLSVSCSRPSYLKEASRRCSS